MKKRFLLALSLILSFAIGVYTNPMMAKQQAEAITKSLNEGKAASSLAVTWQDFMALRRDAPVPVASILKVAFRLPAPKANTWTAASTASGKDYAVVAVSKVDAGVSSLSDEQKKQFGTLLANARGQQELQDYIAYLRTTAKIKQTEVKKDAE